MSLVGGLIAKANQPQIAQTIQAGAASKLHGITQQVNVELEKARRFFTLELRNVDGSVAPGRLQPGNSYVIRAAATANPNEAFEQLEVRILDQLLLMIEAEPADSVDILGADAEMSAEKAVGWINDFEVTIREKVSAQAIRFRLNFRESVRTSVWNSAVSFEIAVDCVPPPPNPIEVPVLAALPPNTAMVYVQSANAEKIQVNAFAHGAPAKWNLGLALPAIQIDKDHYLKSLQEAAIKFSEDNLLSQWIQENVLAFPQAERVLFVVDEADTHFPWELLKIKDVGYLGAQVATIRWLPFATDQRPDFENKEVKGHVTAYIRDGDPVRKCPIVTALSGTLLDLADDVQYNVTDNVALVYLGDDSILHDLDNAAPLEGLAGSKVKLSLLDLPDLKEKPIVFTDAPHTGWVWRSGTGLAGLPKTVLARMGVAFIGTLGPVDRDVAARIAEKIFTHAKNRCCLVRLLTEMRKEGQECLNQLGKVVPADREKTRRQALAPFVYAYYGGPRVYLEVTNGG